MLDGRCILCESEFDSPEEAHLLLDLMPDKPCVIVPSTTPSGIEAPFELRYRVRTHWLYQILLEGGAITITESSAAVQALVRAMQVAQCRPAGTGAAARPQDHLSS
jgi:hypothetical protein